jgi:hypothetical protein
MSSVDSYERKFRKFGGPASSPPLPSRPPRAPPTDDLVNRETYPSELDIVSACRPSVSKYRAVTRNDDYGKNGRLHRRRSPRGGDFSDPSLVCVKCVLRNRTVPYRRRLPAAHARATRGCASQSTRADFPQTARRTAGVGEHAPSTSGEAHEENCFPSFFVPRLPPPISLSFSPSRCLSLSFSLFRSCPRGD